VFKQILQYVALENFVPEMITMLLDTYVAHCRDSDQASEETSAFFCNSSFSSC
jgi:hypothetical protein